MDFDQALQADPALDTLNWFVRIDDYQRTVVGASVLGARVTLTTGGIPPYDPGDDVVSFRPPPFDVLSTLGLPAEAFEDFPLTAG